MKNAERKKQAGTPTGQVNLADLSMDEAMAVLNERYGAGTVVSMTDALKFEGTSRIPTGITALDIALGGGIPKGRVTEFYGPFSSFKSTAAMKCMSAFQKEHPDPNDFGAYIDVEHTFDAKYAATLGVEPERTHIVNPEHGEQAANVLRDLLTREGNIFVIIDSIAALVPVAVQEGTMEQQHMAVVARLVNRMMADLVARMKQHYYLTDSSSITVLALNQLRVQPGVMFGNPEYTPGGKGKDFAYSAVVRLSSQRSKAITEDQTINGVKNKVQFGQTVAFKVIKNKCGGPQHEEGEFIFYDRPYKGHAALSFNNLDALFDYGAFANVITLETQGKKDRFVYRGKVKGLPVTLSGGNRPAFIKELAAAPAVLRNKLKQAIIAAINNPETFTA